MNLTLYRRHRLDCTKSYAQGYKLHQPNTAREKAKDCACPIVASGKLKECGIFNRSLHTSDWSAAYALAERWESWGKPFESAQPQASETVEHAVFAFLTHLGPKGKKVEASTMKGFEILLKTRLGEFIKTAGVHFISEFDQLETTDAFIHSWRNLQEEENVPLADSTKKTEIERLRAFFAWCMEHGWLKINQAKNKTLRFKYRTPKKFGMSPNEEIRLFNEIGDDQELHAFCLVMRHAGLRISDATTLNDTELIDRASGSQFAIRLFQKKTQEWVYIPVADEAVAALRRLPFKGEKEGKRYWFWTAEGTTKTAKKNWYARIRKVVVAANAKTPFLHNVSPHVFRHTFSIAHLNTGTDIKMVSRWLGHKSVLVTEQHYAHIVHQTLVASDESYNQSVQRQRRKTLTVAA